MYIPFLFKRNKFISKQSWHVKLPMLTQARRNRGFGAKLIEITNFTLTSKKNVSTKVNCSLLGFLALKDFQSCPDDKDAFF